MYEYSPIKEIRVKNFRNIGDVSIDFTKSPIVTLLGENESGKTSIVKAFGVAAMHQSPRYQKDFIRTGSSGFGVAIELMDGTVIVRMKTTNGVNLYKVVTADGQTQEFEKLGSELPKVVQDVMGLIEEPETKELLHIRTYEDQLLFVTTPSSVNYKVMYDALKISSITRAIQAGSKEANALKANINADNNNIEAFANSLKNIKIYDIEPVLNIREQLKAYNATLDKLEKAEQLMTEISSLEGRLGALNALKNIDTVDEAEVYSILRAERLINNIHTDENKLSSFDKAYKADNIDESLFGLVEEAIVRKETLDKMISANKTMIDIGKVDTVSEVELMQFNKACELMRHIDKQMAQLKVYDTSKLVAIEADYDIADKADRAVKLIKAVSDDEVKVGQIEAWITQVLAWLQSIGVATETCPNCGSTVVIDLDKLKDN